jgi:predicted DsbA family dithiol-disulfide isomerase
VRIEKLRAEYDLSVRWIAFPLHPETPPEGRLLEDLFRARRADMEETMARLKRVARELGLPLGERKRTYNSRLAQELGKWAESKGRGDLFHDAVFRAYFVEGRNIGDPEELVDLAAKAGLSSEEAGKVLRARTFRETVDADWERSRAMDISAVPTFVAGGEQLVGAQHYEVLAGFVERLGARKRKGTEPRPLSA